ncbi:hypothetical protein TNCV_1007651 [Trichonephila clavipes]|nr:hypothetical protein TNCV_1007651 [Trichonephila clavipes]
MTPSEGPVCLGRRQFGCKRSPSLILTTTGTKAELAFVRKHNRSSLPPPMSSDLIPVASQTAMAWSHWSTLNRAPVSELSLK